MAKLAFSYSYPNYLSATFGGSVLASISFASEGFHLVTIESSNDEENWTRIQSEVVNLSRTFRFSAPSKSALYRFSCKEAPASATIDSVIDDTTTHDDIVEVINETVAAVAKTGKAADVSLNAITGLMATQVQAAIAEIVAKTIALGAAISYEGQVADATALNAIDTTSLRNGAMYNMVAANGNIPAGTNYVWNGTEWDSMVGQIDLTPFLKSTDAANTYVPLAATVSTSGSDAISILALNSAGKAVAITPKILAEHILKNVIDETLIAKS